MHVSKVSTHPVDTEQQHSVGVVFLAMKQMTSIHAPFSSVLVSINS